MLDLSDGHARLGRDVPDADALEAVAYERGKTTERSTSWNLRIGLRAEPGQLTAERETNAAEGFLFPNAGGVVYGLLLSKFSRVCKRLAQALANPESAPG